MKPLFDHEKLVVYRESLAFCRWVGQLLAATSTKAAVKDQIDRASTSIPLNIAEGNGKFSNKDRARFFEIARGSALECAACLDVFVSRDLAAEEAVAEQKEQLARIVRMLMGLLERFSPHADFLREDPAEYGAEDFVGDQEQEQEQD